MKTKKLGQKDLDKLWGENTPYSQVRMSEETRILGDGVSRVFMVVEAEINPFTFEYVLENRKVFAGDVAIQQLLDQAEYRDHTFGYVVCAGQEELIDERSFMIVKEYRELAMKNVLKMHNFVIDRFGLKRNPNKKVRGNKSRQENINTKKYIWNETSGRVIPVNKEISESIDKLRYYVVLVIADGQTLCEPEIKWMAKKVNTLAMKFNVEIENVSAGMGYTMFTFLIGHEVVPSDFIEKCINETNGKSDLLKNEYLITNAARPTGNEIESFIQHLD